MQQFLFDSILAWNGLLPGPCPGSDDAYWGRTHAMTERGAVAVAAAQAEAEQKPGVRLRSGLCLIDPGHKFAVYDA
ncbi:hypothetical protein OH76DRAFT_1481360 [Lentinus brumalis]|uniref:Uncharacterized protein n=1 Tax=Lentinus brumalis TaxID=2498619 RepID=A0A371DFV8_9APHY|nr:hypothetical protein OH76DRAFT_1481360 [Polyporus brumalis]